MCAIMAAVLNSTLSFDEAAAVEARLLAGDLDLLYVAPERLLTPRCLNLLGRAKSSKFFDMFYRASEKGNGSGLGLFIVKEAIQKLKGTIQVQSELGKGTEFIVRIPNLIRDTE